MSYILDALRKAENDRSVGDTPKLDFSALSESRSRKVPGIWLLVAALGVCVGVLGAMQLSQYLAADRQTESAVTAAPPPAPAAIETRQAEAPPPAAAPVVEQQAAAAPPKPARRSVQVKTPQGPVEVEMPLQAGGVKPAPQTSKPAAPPEPEPQPVAEPAKPASKPVQGTAAPVQAAPPRPEPETVTTSPEPAPLSLPSPAELAAELEGLEPVAAQEEAPPTLTPDVMPEPQAEPEPENLVSYLGLPPDIRNDIGELAMNAHVYSSTPGRGFVIVNGRRYRAGDALQEGPVLEDIRPEGAVMTYRGRRFMLPVPR